MSMSPPSLMENKLIKKLTRFGAFFGNYQVIVTKYIEGVHLWKYYVASYQRAQKYLRSCGYYMYIRCWHTSSQILPSYCFNILFSLFLFFSANNVYEQGNSSILLRCMSNHHHFENNIVARWDPLGQAIYCDSFLMHSSKSKVMDYDVPLDP